MPTKSCVSKGHFLTMFFNYPNWRRKMLPTETQFTYLLCGKKNPNTFLNNQWNVWDSASYFRWDMCINKKIYTCAGSLNYCVILKLLFSEQWLSQTYQKELRLQDAYLMLMLWSVSCSCTCTTFKNQMEAIYKPKKIKYKKNPNNNNNEVF